MPSGSSALRRFGPATRAWFTAALGRPTAAQEGAWEAISGGGDALIIAPTGSGKTLAAFLHGIDRLFAAADAAAAPTTASPGPARPATRVLYLSPMKALAADVRENLRAPLDGIAAERRRRGEPDAPIAVGVRTGDSTPREREQLRRHPPDILITTPESLYLMLTSRARETLRAVDTVIVDEIHALAGTKRGAHLALSLERLDALLAAPAQRIGLSATVRPPAEVARFLGGTRPVAVVSPPAEKRWDLRIVVPDRGLGDLGPGSPGQAAAQPDGLPGGPGPGASGRGAGSIWPQIEARVLDAVLAHRSTIVFANSRGLAEKLTARLNELGAARLTGEHWQPDAAGPARASLTGGTASQAAGAPPVIARAHHGSVSKEQRALIEADLKAGRLRCVVATSSLELGIDMGAVDLVVQIAPPPSVASGLQRLGRAGHRVGEVSTGLVFPRTRRETVVAAVAVQRLLAGEIEELRVPENPLDVLAQQTVAAAVASAGPGGLDADAWFETVRRAAPFRRLPRTAFDGVLDMLSGRFGGDADGAFASFRPRLVWDRATGRLTARPGAQRLAVTSGGTIPDRGQYTVLLPAGDEQAGSRRVGELDEEMVYESRVGDVIALGASSWRIEEITSDQVVVQPAPGRSARLPFWHGAGPGRPAEFGAAVGAFVRQVAAGDDAAEADEGDGAAASSGLDDAGRALVADLVREQRQATGVAPSDRDLVLERCRDEAGDWRLVLHSPYGRRVHAPWALLAQRAIADRFGVDGQVTADDDGIVARLPGTVAASGAALADLFALPRDDLAGRVRAEVGGSALFAARFRECAARALLLPGRTPGRRAPLWQQRLRSAQLLQAAGRIPDFPIVAEAAREVLSDDFDLPALRRLAAALGSGRVRLSSVETAVPSPFAAPLLFGYVGAFMYAGDAPAAERSAALLSVDPDLLRELLGEGSPEAALDPAVLHRIEDERQRLAPERRLRVRGQGAGPGTGPAAAEPIADLLRELGPLDEAELSARLDADPGVVPPALRALARAGRIVPVRLGGQEHGGQKRWAAVEDAAALRDALGTRLPAGIPAALLAPARDPLRGLVGRYARVHGPFDATDAAARLGTGTDGVRRALEALERDALVRRGRFPSPDRGPGHPGETREWMDAEVFAQARARSLQAARARTRPVTPEAYARFVLARQGVTAAAEDASRPAELEGAEAVADVLDQLAGVPLPASAWEAAVLPARVPGYEPRLLDEVLAGGEVAWVGRGRLGDDDGLIAFVPSDGPAGLAPARNDPAADEPLERALRSLLADGGAYPADRLGALLRARESESAGADGAGSRPFAALTAPDLAAALWRLVWAGAVTADGFAPVRALLASGTGRRERSRARASQVRRLRRRRGIAGFRPVGSAGSAGSASMSSSPSSGGAATVPGRWLAVPAPAAMPESGTQRAVDLVEALADRYGVITRGAVAAEGVPGGFAGLQPVLRGMEDAGRLLRGRFVEGLGGAQFADRDVVDALRDAMTAPAQPVAVTLAAADPANPYGAALPWPEAPGTTRPNRRAGALAVLVDGRLELYLAAGGTSLTVFADPEPDPETLAAAATALAELLRRARPRPFTIETVNGSPATTAPAGAALGQAGFAEVPRGWRWYG
ncbi:MAG: ATP-dependent helicase [Pseudoclavibacter sp.]